MWTVRHLSLGPDYSNFFSLKVTKKNQKHPTTLYIKKQVIELCSQPNYNFDQTKIILYSTNYGKLKGHVQYFCFSLWKVYIFTRKKIQM